MDLVGTHLPRRVRELISICGPFLGNSRGPSGDAVQKTSLPDAVLRRWELLLQSPELKKLVDGKKCPPSIYPSTIGPGSQKLRVHPSTIGLGPQKLTVYPSTCCLGPQ